MTIPTPNKLRAYHDALEKWKDHKGPEGKGGAWNPKARTYEFAPQPKPEEFALSGDYELKLAGQIKAQLKITT